MIDTIIMNLKAVEFTELSWCKFKLLRHTNDRMGQPYSIYVLNPTTADREVGRQVPRLSKTVRGNGMSLKIEFSAPKLVKGNNFDELVDDDFDTILKNLATTLRNQGIIIWPHQIGKNEVSGIHYSKNIVLPQYITCSMVLTELEKADWSKRFDVTRVKFSNGGRALHIHTNYFELVFYDKMNDLEQARISEKRAIEKDNAMQLSLFDEWPRNRKPEVLRMELRLREKRKIRHVLNKLGLNQDITLEVLFSQSIAKAALLLYWQQVKECLDLLSIDPSDPVTLLEGTLRRNPDVRFDKVLALTIMAVVINTDKGGIRRLREMISPYITSKTWYRYKKQLQQTDFQEVIRYQPLIEVGKALESFETLRLVDFQAIMLNNDKNES